MSIDPETLMAYADGECDPLSARRVEKAMAADPAITAEVEAHRALRMQLSNAFAPVADEPIPARIAAPLTSNVVAFPGRPRRRFSAAWAGAVAASLVIGLYGAMALGGLLIAAIRENPDLYRLGEPGALGLLGGPAIGLAAGGAVVALTRVATRYFQWARDLHGSFRDLLGR